MPRSVKKVALQVGPALGKYYELENGKRVYLGSKRKFEDIQRKCDSVSFPLLNKIKETAPLNDESKWKAFASEVAEEKQRRL